MTGLFGDDDVLDSGGVVVGETDPEEFVVLAGAGGPQSLPKRFHVVAALSNLNLIDCIMIC